MNSSQRALSLVAGCLLLFAAIWMMLTLGRLGRDASEHDTAQKYSLLGKILPCTLEEVAVPRVMSVRESHPLVVNVVREEGPPCESTVEVSATNFEFSPGELHRTIMLDAGRFRDTATWVMSPKQTGEYTIVVNTGADVQTFGVVVTNVLGFRAKPAQIITYVGSVLGPMLTVPWWLDRIKSRGARRAKRKQSR